jgi:hypothetical protein
MEAEDEATVGECNKPVSLMSALLQAQRRRMLWLIESNLTATRKPHFGN